MNEGGPPEGSPLCSMCDAGGVVCHRRYRKLLLERQRNDAGGTVVKDCLELVGA